MALISCPECGKQISETTPSCPHCGYLLSSAVQQQAPAPTKIADVKKNIPVGIICVIVGPLFSIICIPFIGVFGIGIFGIIGGVMTLVFGITKITGIQDIVCPHCGKRSQIGKSDPNFKCPICKKRSVRDGEYLKPIM